jgi:hypothetical protein
VVYWTATPCTLSCGYRRFVWTFCLHLQDWTENEEFTRLYTRVAPNVVTENQGKGNLFLANGNFISRKQISHPKHFNIQDRITMFLRKSRIRLQDYMTSEPIKTYSEEWHPMHRKMNCLVSTVGSNRTFSIVFISISATLCLHIPNVKCQPFGCHQLRYMHCQFDWP